MRLSVNLDDDLYAVAKALAKDDDISISSAINLLLRKALEPKSARGTVLEDGTGLPVVEGRRRLTCEEVYRFEQELEGGVLGAER